MPKLFAGNSQPTGSKGWGIPKGGVEPGEDLEEAARREFFEETGVELLGCRNCQSDVTDVSLTNSCCTCSSGRVPLYAKYLNGSGDDIRGGKKIHA